MATGKPIVSKSAPNLVTLINCMYSNPGKRFTAKDLAPRLSCKPNSIYLYIRAASLYYPDNVKKEAITGGGANGSFVTYYWDDNGVDPFKDDNTVQKAEKSSIKNGEGYPDMTATKAIKNCEIEAPAPMMISGKDGHRPLPGDIWVTSTAGKADEYFLVLANHDTYAVTGLRLSKETPTVKKLIPIPFDFTVILDDGTPMIADASMITYKWRKYMLKLVDAVEPKDMDILKGKVRIALGITEQTRVEYVEKPVYKEKIVEKKVEVPVEKIVYKEKEIETPKIPEGCVSEEAFNVALLKQERDIWKTVAESLMKRI